MNKMITGCWLLWVFFQGGAAIAQSKTAAYEVLGVAFYNLENFFDPQDDPHKSDEDFTPDGNYRYTETVYQQKTEQLAYVLSRLGTETVPDGPVLIGVSEVENARVLENLVSRPSIQDRKYRFVHLEGPDVRGIDVALLYRPDYFRVLYARSLYVDLRLAGKKKGKTRDILHVCGILAGDTVHVLVNHWPSRRGGLAASAGSRAVAAGVCKSLTDSLLAANKYTRILIMGDFNDDPVNLSISRILDARDDRRKVTLHSLYNPWGSFFKKGIGTLGYNDRWHLFDQILLSGAFLQSGKKQGWQYHKAEIFNREFLQNRFGKYKGYPHRSFRNRRWDNGYSDHFPVLVYLRKPR